MHHDENDPRHSHHNRDMRHRREQQPDHERERYFNDFKSRWGEPSPPLDLHRNDWQSQDIGRFEREGQFHQHREEWLPNQRGQQQPKRNENQQRDTSWRQRDVNFDRNNQRAENRWRQDDSIPHPDDSRRRRRSLPDQDGFRHDNNERDNRDRR